MTTCEWVVKDPEDTCKREGRYSIQLKGSNSASNIFFACWQHVKKYRNRKFLEESFGKGARVEIRDEQHWQHRSGNWHK